MKTRRNRFDSRHRKLKLEHLEDRRMLATFTVTNLDDAGPGSLRQAVLDANGLIGSDEVVFDPSLTGGTINLLSQIDVIDRLTIDASSIGGINIDLSTADPTPGVGDGMGIRAFDVQLKKVTISHVNIAGGDVDGDGGAIRATSYLQVLDSTLTNNMASSQGGAVFAFDLLTISTSTVSGNSAFHAGGGVGARGYTFIENSTISNNSAHSGGGIQATEVLTIVSSTISNNSSDTAGGIWSRGELTIANSTISNNSGSGGSGGGIFTYEDTLIEDSTISDNYALGRGGGIHTNTSSQTIDPLTIKSSTISNNFAGSHGGGIFSDDKVLLERVAITNNYSALGGGGVSVIDDSLLELLNTTVSGNSTAGSGGGIELDDTQNTHRIEHSTIANNTANADGVGVGDNGGGVSGFDPVRFRNTIIADNVTISGGIPVPEDIAGAFTSFDYTIIEANPLGVPIIGTGNMLGVDPLLGSLADNGGPTLTHALLTGSTAIDNGDPAFSPPPYTDQRGYSYDRLQDGNGDGVARIDIGSFELQEVNQPPIADAGDDQEAIQSVSVTLDGSNSSDPDNGPDPLTFSWNVISGPGPAMLGSPNAALTSFVAGDVGTYTVELEVNDGESTSTDTVEVTVDLNSPPVADASLSDMEGEVGVQVVLDGTLSSDPDGEPLDYLWTLLAVPAGSTASIDDPVSVTTFFVPDLPGSHSVELTVCDAHQCASTDPFAITVAAAPTASATAPDIVAVTAAPQTIMVTYEDDIAIDVSTLRTGNIDVQLPDLSTIAPTFISASSAINTSPVTAIYELSPPDGFWDSNDNGTYAILVNVNEVLDTGDNPVVPGTIGTFSVDVDAVSPQATASAPNITTNNNAAQTITVTYTDNLAVDGSTIGSNDIEVQLPDGPVVVPTFISSSSSDNISPITATYELPAIGGIWDSTDDGTYTILAIANEVFDTAGNPVAAGPIGSFSVIIAANVGLFEDRATALGSGFNNDDVDLADLDGDGYLDAFVTTRNGGNQVWFNDGQGTFTDSGQSLGSDSNVYAVLGDIDDDGDVDALVAALGDQELVLWRNDGAGSFTLGSRIVVDSPLDVGLGDLDGDDDLDVFLAQQSHPDLVFFNDGFGNLFNSGQALGNTQSKSVEFGDIDADGDLDVVVGVLAGGGGAPNRVWLNDGAGVFTDSGQSLGNAFTQHVALGDLNGDGFLDAVATDGDTWLNDGSGILNPGPSNIGLPTNPTSHVAIADFDLDGDLDVFQVNWFNEPDRVWLNDGVGNFTDSGQALGADTSSHVALGDIDGDLDIDAVIATFNVTQPNRIWFNTTNPDRPRGDFNLNGVLDADDIDLLCLAIQAGDATGEFDLNNNGVLDSVDFRWLLEMMETRLGDANLDGIVDDQDFTIWNVNKFQSNDPSLPDVGWATADFNCDGVTDGFDLLIWNANKTISPPAIPNQVDNRADRSDTTRATSSRSGRAVSESSMLLDDTKTSWHETAKLAGSTTLVPAHSRRPIYGGHNEVMNQQTLRGDEFKHLVDALLEVDGLIKSK